MEDYHGKIRQMLLFCPGVQSADGEKPYDEILLRYGGIFEKLARHHPVEFIVIFDIELNTADYNNTRLAAIRNLGAPLPGSRVIFVCTNALPDGLRVELGWTQDVIIDITGNELFYIAEALQTKNRMSKNAFDPRLAGLLNLLLSQYRKTVPLHGIAGGNWLPGTTGKQSYLLHCGMNSAALRRAYPSALEKYSMVINLKNKYMEKFFDDLFYHVDLFVMNTGRVKKKGGTARHLFLIAAPQNGDESVDNETLEKITAATKKVGHRLKKAFGNDCDIFYVPFIITHFKGFNDLRALSYANCFTETYQEPVQSETTETFTKKSKTKTVIYFPDYREIIQVITLQRMLCIPQHIQHFLDKQEQSFSLRRNLAPEEAIPTIAVSNEIYEEAKKIKRFADAMHEQKQFAQALQDKLEKDLIARYENVYVEFVPHNYENILMGKGGLHCIAKVTQRAAAYI